MAGQKDEEAEDAVDTATICSELPDRRRPGVQVHRTVSPGPNEWHPGIDSELLHATLKRNSSSGVSSLVQDNGDTQQLAENVRQGVAPQSTPFDVAHAGAGFEDDTHSIKSRLSISEELFLAPNTPESSQDREENPDEDYDYLQSAIVASRLESLEKDGHYFLPLDSMGKIITVPNIEKELRKYDIDRTNHDLRRIAQEVMTVKAMLRKKGSKRKTCRRRIFSVLAMMKRSDAIIEVLEEGIYDDDMPFKFVLNNKNYKVFRRQRGGSDPEVVQFLGSWEFADQEMFISYQWQMKAPYFEMSWEPGERVYHYPLAPQDVIPFVKETAKDSSLDGAIDFSGGTSTVHKVKIHKAHYNCSQKASIRGNPYFAVKKLKMSDEIAKARGREVDREALALKRFVDVQDKENSHHHLIRLLATYSHKNHFHMILPCAEGNLQDFWQKHPKPSDPPRDWTLACWISKQCLGLARALQRIHMSRVHDSNPQNLHPNYLRQHHGRHGDLKPENILFFGPMGTDADDDSIGVLKISDFGFADFHRSNSLNVISNSSIGGITLTYRAPEFDVTHRVSPAYDIWGFGCVLLQFVVWYIRGWPGVEEFSKKRTSDSNSSIPEDSFFNFDEKKLAAKSKVSVSREINELRQHEACSDFTLDLLNYIQTAMLKLKPKSRAGCDEIVRQLEQICMDCQQDQKYCTERMKVLQQTPTDRSEFVRYMEPPKDHPDPINLVEASSISGLSPAMSAQGPDLDPSGAELTLEPTEMTPLMNGTHPAHNEVPDTDTDTLPGLTIFGRLWRKLGAVFSCCIARGGE